MVAGIIIIVIVDVTINGHIDIVVVVFGITCLIVVMMLIPSPLSLFTSPVLSRYYH